MPRTRTGRPERSGLRSTRGRRRCIGRVADLAIIDGNPLDDFKEVEWYVQQARAEQPTTASGRD